jgi:imidazolonepropionase
VIRRPPKGPHKVLRPRGDVPAPASGATEGLLVVHAAELVTLRGPWARPRRREEMRDLGIVPDGAVYLEGERVKEVGDTRDVLRVRNGTRNMIDATGKVVMPGLVDAHTHAAFVGSRHHELPWKAEGLSYQEIAARGGGILSTVRDTRAAPREALAAATRKRLDGMLRFGTTTAEVKSGYGLTVESELEILRAIDDLSGAHPMGLVSTFLGAHAVPAEHEGRADAYADLVANEMVPAVATRSGARFCDVWVEQGAFTPEQARRIFAAAKARGLDAKVHADELSDSGGAALAAEVGAVSADHLLHTDQAGLRGMAEAGVIGVLLPATSLAAKLPFADARAIIGAGVPVALGTDLSPGSWNESMQTVMALATHRLGMYPEEAVVAATVNAAFAVGKGREVGTLDPGMAGDLLVLDADSVGHLGYRFGGNLVEKVVKAGRVVLDRAPVR